MNKKNLMINQIKIISIFLGFLLITRAILLFNSPLEEFIKVVPDDSFYYLKLSCNFIDKKTWTFDGLNNTSGFHLIYAYLLVFFNKFLGCQNWRITYLLMSLIAAFLISLSCYLTSNLVRKKVGYKYAIFASTIFFGRDVILQSTAGMESGLVIFISSLLFYIFFKNENISSLKKEKSFLNHKKNFLLFLLGIFLIGIRTDFLILSLIFYSSIQLRKKLKVFFKEKNHEKGSSQLYYDFKYLFVGTIVGYLLVAFHNYFFTKSFLQNSASIKFYWSSKIGHIKEPIFRLIGGNLPIPISWFNFKFQSYIIFALIFLIFAILINKIIKGRKLKIINFYFDDENLLNQSVLLTLLGYGFFYSFNSAGIQTWYISQFLTPLVIFISYFLKFIENNLKLLKFSYLISLVLIINIFSGVYFSFNYRPYANQTEMLAAGKFLKNNFNNSTIGSWNSGIIGFFSKRDIVNIDGLVNNSVAPYIKNDNLISYFKKAKIDYVIDYETMLTNEYYSRRGGFSDRKLNKCLEKLEFKMDQSYKKFENSNIYLFKFKDKC
ncbi:MAG: hypothetical protein JJ846_007965 [Prochlorococcus marinus CUG1437]|nr:hypothetical protein [Prochlorococcus marinus CUG1437]